MTEKTTEAKKDAQKTKPKKEGFFLKLYNWTVAWADKPSSEKALAGVSFAESSFFPIPPDPLLIALVTAKPSRWFRFALITTIASILGGIFGYLIGWVLFESVGTWILNTYHLQEAYVSLGMRFEDNALIAVFTAAMTPIPYKLITITAGAFQINFLAFIAASVVGRSFRFFLEAWAMHHFGRRYKHIIERYVNLLSWAFLLLILVGFIVLKYFV